MYSGASSHLYGLISRLFQNFYAIDTALILVLSEIFINKKTSVKIMGKLRLMSFAGRGLSQPCTVSVCHYALTNRSKAS